MYFADCAGNMCVLCVQNDVIVAQCSAPNIPPYLVNMSHDTRKSVFGVYDQV